MIESWGLAESLQQRRDSDLYRQTFEVGSSQGPELLVEGQTLLAFCSNDYLGLASHPVVVDAFANGLREYGAGAAASHLVSGHMVPHQQLEQALARFTGRDRALLFSSGYLANLGVITALLGKGDAVFQDRLNHASLLDGGLLSGARFRRYRHGDCDSLQRLLVGPGQGRRLVITDGVFSMDGDIAPLPELAELCRQENACLMVDDAHGIGVLGERGGGTVQHFNLSQQEVPIVMGTLGKSFGVMGAFVTGSEELIETLIQSARSYIYTTALPPAAATATLAALELIINGQGLRQQLQVNIQRFRSGAQQLGLKLLESSTAIQAVVLGDSATALSWSHALRSRGILVPAIRPPTVPDGGARLRITLSAAHDETQVDRLLRSLGQIQAVER